MQPQTISSCKHQDIATTSFHDIHENKVGEYGSSSGLVHDSDIYTKNSDVSAEDLDLEDRNLEDIPIQRAKLMTPLFEPLTHMRALDLEVLSVPEFPKYPFLYTNTLKGLTTNEELHVGMQF